VKKGGGGHCLLFGVHNYFHDVRKVDWLTNETPLKRGGVGPKEREEERQRLYPHSQKMPFTGEKGGKIPVTIRRTQTATTNKFKEIPIFDRGEEGGPGLGRELAMGGFVGREKWGGRQ